MARKPRTFIEGLPYYICQKGNNATDCFLEHGDFRFYLDRLKVAASEYKVEVHAYVLLQNAAFLLATPRAKNGISQLMKIIGGGYSRYFNRKYAHTGSLWEARFRSNIVQPGLRLLELQKFFELTPTRVGLVEHPGEYQWSSFVPNALGCPAKWITPHPAYLALGEFQGIRYQDYRHFVLKGDLCAAAEISQMIQMGKPIAEGRYCVELNQRFGLDVSARPIGRPKKLQRAKEASELVGQYP